MKNKIALLIAGFLLISACALPTGVVENTQSPDAISTAAAATVAAELTRAAGENPPPPPQATDTFVPTNTQVLPPTLTPIPCLNVGYTAATIDQTIPDNTVMNPGQFFLKTWRLINTGSCTWNASYKLVFDHGDGMGVPAGYAQALTAGTVAPGQSVDVSVNLTAPMAPGTYTGYWRFRDPNGVLFGIDGAGAWIVKIIVVDYDVATLSPMAGISGTIRSGGGPWPDYTVGESNADITKTTEVFLTYDLSGIPAGSTISEVKIDFRAYVIDSGNPFGLGTLYGYATNYGNSLEPADWVAALPPGTATVTWASTADLDSLRVSTELQSAVQSALASGRFQLRLQFAGSNLNATKDRLQFTNPTLVVTYANP
jgi:hypothetical protein